VSDLAGNVYRVVGGVFTTLSPSTGKLFLDTGANVDDYIAFRAYGQCNKPRGLRLHVGTAWTAVGLTTVWEYRRADGSWNAFSGVVDATNGFSTAGTNLDVTWTVPTDWGSNPTAVNNLTGNMWYRLRITALTSYTVGPLLGGVTPVTTQIYDNAVRVDAGHSFDSGTSTSVGGNQTLVDTGKAWTVDALRGRIMYIHTGTGAGQNRVVKSNTATALTLFHVWDTIPDDTSQYVICANFRDLYDADVAGGWGVITTIGNHSFAFNSFLEIQAGAFGDVSKTVEFVRDYYFYTVSTSPHDNTYQLHFGWRVPSYVGLDLGIFGNTISTNRTSAIDERNSGFWALSSFVFSNGNRYILRFEMTLTNVTGFIRKWHSVSGATSINDYFEGWRSVLFAKVSPQTEVRNLVVAFGHTGIETPRAAFTGVKSYFNSSLAMYVTSSTNFNLPDFRLGLNNAEASGNIFSNPLAYFSYTGTTTKYVNLSPRFRPMYDAYSTGSVGRSQPQVSIRALITDEKNNPLQNATMRISDSLEQNKFNCLSYDLVDNFVSAPNNAVGNQFSGSTAFSVEAWVNAGTSGEAGLGSIINKLSASAGYRLFMQGTNFRFSLVTSAGTANSNTVAAITNGWKHVVGVWNGTDIRIYVDNVAPASVGTSGTATNDTAESLFIGNNSAGTNTFDGLIRRVRIFRNKALSVAEVGTLWNSGDYIQVEACPVAGCTAEYNHTEGSGTTLADTSGNAVTATLGAGVTAPTWYNNNNGQTTQAFTLPSGVANEFLANQVVTLLGVYSLTTQPTAGTRLRITVNGYVKSSTATAQAGRITIRGTDNDNVAIFEAMFLEEYGNGSYLTQNEFKTVDASGLVTAGFTGIISIDRAGMTYPQNINIESWSAPNDRNLLVGNFNPVTLKITAPGYDPVTIKKTMYEKQDLHIAMKKSVLDLT